MFKAVFPCALAVLALILAVDRLSRLVRGRLGAAT
jgi:hypothetical protein